MKKIVNILAIIGLVWWFWGDNLKLPDIIRPQPIVVELQMPDKFVSETSTVKELVPENAKLDLLVFHDEFSKKLNTYSDKNVTSQQIIGRFYPEALYESFGDKYKGKLGDFINFKKGFVEKNLFSQDKFLTSQEIQDLSKFYSAVAWNLSPTESN
jgi:hypothetical protein